MSKAKRTAAFPRGRRGPFGNAVWNVKGHRYYWNGPGSRLYLLLGKDGMTTIDHRSADGSYETFDEARAALRRFVNSPR